jgi:hypothetical protein
MSVSVETRMILARMVTQRLERLSADSAWAHISSGYRGSLIKTIDRLERLPELESASTEDISLLDYLIDKGLDLLAKAAREMGDPELLRFASQPRPRG